MSIAERVRAVVEYSGSNIADFSRYCGIPYDSLLSAIHERRPCNLAIVTGIITHFPEIDPRWLITGEGEMLSVPVRAAIERVRLSFG